MLIEHYSLEKYTEYFESLRLEWQSEPESMKERSTMNAEESERWMNTIDFI